MGWALPHSCLFTPGLGTEVPKAPSCPRALHSWDIRKLQSPTPLHFSVAKLPLKIHLAPQLYEQRPFFSQALFPLWLQEPGQSPQSHLHGLACWMTWTPHTPDSWRLQPVPRHPHSVCPGAGPAAASALPGCSVSGKRPFCPSLFWEVENRSLGVVFRVSLQLRNLTLEMRTHQNGPQLHHGLHLFQPRDLHPNRRPSRLFLLPGL